MEVVAATFRRTSESRQVHSLPGARPVGWAPFLCTHPVLTEPPASIRVTRGDTIARAGWMSASGGFARGARGRNGTVERRIMAVARGLDSAGGRC